MRGRELRGGVEGEGAGCVRGDRLVNIVGGSGEGVRGRELRGG